MTSLSQQLRKLAVPQTSGLADLKKRPSILFEPKEAAVKDRKTIYDLGCQGLKELIAINHEFAQFEETLFQHNSLHIERSVEDSNFNKELDKNIRKFFIHMSPYFMLRSSHMCLEWMIRRFQVQDYNKDDFMLLIMPYHETNIFVKCVQILRIKTPTDPWHWLLPIQKPGVPLPKTAVINRVAHEPSFLSFICKGVSDAIKELGAKASSLQCLINFYSSVVIGAFENCNELKEWHITTILPCLLKGLKSKVNDFISSSLMITSQLVRKTRITEKLLNVLVLNICKIQAEKLQSPCILLLCWMAQTQSEIFTSFPYEAYEIFITKKSVIQLMGTVSREELPLHYVLMPLVRTTVDLIRKKQKDIDQYKRFLENVLHEVRLSSASAKLVIRLILEALVLKEDSTELNAGDVIDLDLYDDPGESGNVNDWYTTILELLEHQYSSEMDKTIKEAFQSNDTDSSLNVLKSAISFRYKFLSADTSSLFQNIYHRNPKIRAMSIGEIVKQINENSINATHLSILKETLADRIKDDNENVVEKILQLPTNLLIGILGLKSFVENLIEILDKANLHPATWGRVEMIALKHLVSKLVVKSYDNNLLLLSLMRYLIPVRNDTICAQFIKTILGSAISENMPFFKELSEKFKHASLDPTEFKKDFFNTLMHVEGAPSALQIIESIQGNAGNYFKTTTQASHVLTLITACLKTNSEPMQTLNILEFIIEQCSFSKTKSNIIPLQLFLDFLNSLVRSTNFGDDLLNWESTSKSQRLFITIFNLLITNSFSIQVEKNDKHIWCTYLKDVLNLVFPSEKNKLDFLSQFFVYDHFEKFKNFTELRIRSIKLVGLILKDKKSTLQLDMKLIIKMLIALSSQISAVRVCTLAILQDIAELVKENDFKDLIEKIIARSEEIQFDGEQISLILYTLLRSKSKKEKLNRDLLSDIISLICDSNEGFELKSKTLEIIKHIKSTAILKAIIPVALEALGKTYTEGNVIVLDKTAANIFNSVIIRIDENCIHEIITHDKRAWQLIENSLKSPKIFMNIVNDKLIPVPCGTLEIFDEATYDKLPTTYKVKFLKLVIETISMSDNDALFLDINKALRRCCLDCKHVTPLLDDMSRICSIAETAQQKKKADTKKPSNNSNLTSMKEWKEGVILLELLENKKKLLNTYKLVPVLFDILKKCLDMENQSPLEYTKQLILSILLQSCQRSDAISLLRDLPENCFRIDLIVHCIRVTQNPQTHYNALLLLSHCAVLFPQQVLHNLVSIFTFMGSSIARHDDAFSFQVISNIIESIIPIIVKDKTVKRTTATVDHVVPVLKIFSDILLDVPEHRRIPLYSKLLQTLGAEQYAWLFLCVVFESQVINEEKEKLSQKKDNSQVSALTSTEKIPKRIEIALDLMHKFDVNVCLQTCISLMSYVRTLPMTKEDALNACSIKGSELFEMELFDAKTRSAKQLRHYKYLILQFISSFTSSVEFLKAVTELNEEEIKISKTLYQQFIIKTLCFVPLITEAVDKREDPTQSKFWKVILHHCYDALDNIISLLSSDMFLVVVHGLMQHQLVTVRKKVIELFINKLQENGDYFENCSEENILKLLQSLSELISGIQISERPDNTSPATNTNDMVFVQQAGLVAIKLLSKHFALNYIEQFKNIIEILTGIMKKRRRMSKIILATVILTLVEVTSNLKVNSISHLPIFMPHLVAALNDQIQMLNKQPSDNVCLALITSTQKLFETMPRFLGPYIAGIIAAISTIWSKIETCQVEQEQRKIVNLTKLNLLWSKIASEVPARILIPNCEKTYYALIEDGNCSSIYFLMKLFAQCISNTHTNDLTILQIELTEFFFKSLGFRSQMEICDDAEGDILVRTEMEIINSFGTWILKLSESSFRPVYKKIYDWALHSDGPKERVLTFFILNKCISESLKSLFVLFALEFIDDAVHLLNACNTTKMENLYYEKNEHLNTELLKNLFCTLRNIFLHDSKGFANSHRFDTLMQPIVDQLENSLVLESDELQSLLLSCIGQLSVAASSDVLWKQLNHQVLLKTRTNIPQIRIIAFNSCVEIAKKLGDDFTSLLPETIPFVAELFEDENAQVVNNTRKAVQEMEVILGESLQKYF